MTATPAEDSSTIALLVAKAATRDWTARLFDGPRHLVHQGQGVIGEQGVGPSGFSKLNPRRLSAVMAVRHRLAGTWPNSRAMKVG